MEYLFTYEAPKPLGTIEFVCDEKKLLALWLPGQDHLSVSLGALRGAAVAEGEKHNLPVACQVRQWLDVYLSGQEPDFDPPMELHGTPFQMEVWQLLRRIPYGKVVTYKEIAGRLAADRGIARMSAQAVGGAVGRNPVSILVPCHRVVGTDGSLTGYNGGLHYKEWLLRREGIEPACLSAAAADQWLN